MQDYFSLQSSSIFYSKSRTNPCFVLAFKIAFYEVTVLILNKDTFGDDQDIALGIPGQVV
jgi:hypothetical protein